MRMINFMESIRVPVIYVSNKMIKDVIIFNLVYLFYAMLLYFSKTQRIRKNLTYLSSEKFQDEYKSKIKDFLKLFVFLIICLGVAWNILLIFYPVMLENFDLLVIFTISIAILVGISFIFMYIGMDFQLKLKNSMINTYVRKAETRHHYFISAEYCMNHAEFYSNQGNLLDEVKWNLKAIKYINKITNLLKKQQRIYINLLTAIIKACIHLGNNKNYSQKAEELKQKAIEYANNVNDDIDINYDANLYSPA